MQLMSQVSALSLRTLVMMQVMSLVLALPALWRLMHLVRLLLVRRTMRVVLRSLAPVVRVGERLELSMM